ncbi:MAG: DNA topoisomerase VI subunit B [Candidatus Anstonellales archaeon]
MAEMSKNFREYSITEFFKKNAQMLGFSGKIRSLTTIVHEYVTNSLDACEEAGILPEIKIKIEEVGEERYVVTVQDNGPGIPPNLVGKALGQMLTGTKFHRYMQQRGQQGIGAAGCTMYALLTTGKPIHVISGHNGKIFECDLSVDLKTNEPVVTNSSETHGDFRGIVVRGEFGNVKYDKGQYGAYEYLKRTALANPHAQIEFTDPDGQVFIFPRSVEQVPQKPKEVLPHPLGVDVHDLLERAKASESTRISSFLQASFSRVSAEKVKEVQALVPEIDFKRNPKTLSWEEAEKIVKAFKQVKWIAPATDSVIPIGKEQIEKSLKNILNPEIVAVVERPPKVYKGGIPYVVEAGIAYGGNQKSSIMRFANRAPLIFDASACAITEVIKNIDWKRYGIKDFENEPITVFVNFSSVYVPYISAGKQAITNDEEIMSEIKNAVFEAARQIERHISGKIRERERATKKQLFMKYISQLSSDIAELSGEKKEVIEKKLIEIVEGKYGG